MSKARKIKILYRKSYPFGKFKYKAVFNIGKPIYKCVNDQQEEIEKFLSIITKGKYRNQYLTQFNKNVLISTFFEKEHDLILLKMNFSDVILKMYEIKVGDYQ